MVWGWTSCNVYSLSRCVRCVWPGFYSSAAVLTMVCPFNLNSFIPLPKIPVIDCLQSIRAHSDLKVFNSNEKEEVCPAESSGTLWVEGSWNSPVQLCSAYPADGPSDKQVSVIQFQCCASSFIEKLFHEKTFCLSMNFEAGSASQSVPFLSQLQLQSRTAFHELIKSLWWGENKNKYHFSLSTHKCVCVHIFRWLLQNAVSLMMIIIFFQPWPSYLVQVIDIFIDICRKNDSDSLCKYSPICMYCSAGGVSWC